MAKELTTAQREKKDRLIAEGCKVVERHWGHLVIMPTMGMALDYFKEALAKKYVYDESDAGGKGSWEKSHPLQHFIGMGGDMSAEYIEKYKKQFEYLKAGPKRDKLYWVIEDAIRNGDPRKIAAVNEISQELVELVYEINPSLRLDTQRNRVENGPIWDAGLIGSDDPRPCWEDHTSQNIKRGAGGDGAYRIIINTDTSFGRSDSENCLVLCAMINVLQQYADVEIWVQQGWVNYHDRIDFMKKYEHDQDSGNSSGMDGVTLFPAFRGSGLNPAQLMFWCGHPMRDSIFSSLINKRIGRSSGGCSHPAELDCDLYTRNGCFDEMPHFNYLETNTAVKDAQLKKLAAWTSKQLSTVLLQEEDIANLQT